jgi:hypothetical protein
MPSRISFAELGLIQAYRSTTGVAERRPIIQSYAEITRLSAGRAEDALDLWVHLLAQHRCSGNSR